MRIISVDWYKPSYQSLCLLACLFIVCHPFHSLHSFLIYSYFSTIFFLYILIPHLSQHLHIYNQSIKNMMIIVWEYFDTLCVTYVKSSYLFSIVWEMFWILFVCFCLQLWLFLILLLFAVLATNTRPKKAKTEDRSAQTVSDTSLKQKK